MDATELEACPVCEDVLCPGCNQPTGSRWRLVVPALVVGLVLSAGGWLVGYSQFTGSSDQELSQSIPTAPALGGFPEASGLDSSTSVESSSTTVDSARQLPSLDDPLDDPLLAKRPAVAWFWDPICVECGREAVFLMNSVSLWDSIINFVSVPLSGDPQQQRIFVETYGISIPEIDGADGRLVSRFAGTDTPGWGLIFPSGEIRAFARGVQQSRLEQEFIGLSRSAPMEVIDTSSESAVRAAFKREFGSVVPPLGWTGSVGSCEPGTTSRLHQEATLSRINWFRAMAGVEPLVTLNDDFSAIAQAAALTMYASGRLDHEPDSTFRCMTSWSYEGASRSNLSLGDSGPIAIDGYIEDEGSNNEEVGHRRWILMPELKEVGTGDTKGSNALLVVGGTKSTSSALRERGLVMWPPRGFVPRSTIYRRWSISAAQAFDGGAFVVVRSGGKTLFNDLVYPDNSIGWPTLVFPVTSSKRSVNPIEVEVFEVNGDGQGPLIVSYHVIPID